MKPVILRILALLLALPLTALAEQSAKFGDIEIHYNALLTSDLRPDVARAYGIDRSKSRGLATIAVLKKNNVGVAVPTKAAIKLSAVNLAGQMSDVAMREIQEQTAIYYIGTFRVGAEETLKFNVEVKPEGGKAEKFDFSKAFYP